MCFNNRSTEFSLPVFKRVVIAKVAMERLASPINASRSSLHLDTTHCCVAATSARVRMEAKRTVGLGDERKT